MGRQDVGIQQGWGRRVGTGGCAVERRRWTAPGPQPRQPDLGHLSADRQVPIKRLYEPLACPRCGGRRKVIAFIEPPQADVTCRPADRDDS
jgi:hypothetical protein